MNNTIAAYIEFSFKGEKLTPSTTIDLDKMMAQNGTLDSIYSILARSNNIDAYSYEYEIMQMVETSYENAQGLAKKHLDIDDIEKHQDIKNAFLEAYNCGKN